MDPDDDNKTSFSGIESGWQWAYLRDVSVGERTRVLRQAATESVSDYAEEGSLSDLELVDDVE